MAIPSDINIAYSILNMRLRDSADSLKDICSDLDYDYNDVMRKMTDAGFSFDSVQRAFK